MIAKRDARGQLNHAPGTILLGRAMRRHGGTVDEFAKDVLGRSRVSIWRWLRKGTPMPEAVQHRLRVYLKETAHADRIAQQLAGEVRDAQPARLTGDPP